MRRVVLQISPLQLEVLVLAAGLVELMTRIEGHSELVLHMKKERLVKIELSPLSFRDFENVLVGKRIEDIPRLVTRICGLCPSAHQVASCKAIETAIGLDVRDEAKILRQVMLMAEAVRSHSFNFFFMTLPDLVAMTSQLKSKDILEVSQVRPGIMKMARELLWCSEKILDSVGGRAVHPISSIIGGISKPLGREGQEEALRALKNAASFSRLTIDLVDQLIKAVGDRYEIFDVKESLQYLTSFDLKGGRGFYGGPLKVFDPKKGSGTELKPAEIVEGGGLSVKGAVDGQVVTGPIARHMTAMDRYRPGPSRKQEYNLLMINKLKVEEIAYSIFKSIELLENWDFSRTPTGIDVVNRKGMGSAAVEAPRGTLIHHYDFDNGRVRTARIVTPTEINRACIGDCVNQVASRCLDLGFLMDDVLDKAKAALRLFDPCVSCVTHTRIMHI